MADDTPPSPDDGTDPLGERLRATLRAEQADIERRRSAHGSAPGATRSASWVPLAAAAAVIVVLAIGVAIMGNRGADESVEVDVAASPTTAPDVAASPPPPTVAAATPAETPAIPTVVPPAPNQCGEQVVGGVHFVWDVAADDPDGGLVAHTAAGVDEPVTRVLPYNAVVGAGFGCVRTSDGAAWRELFAGNNDRDWVNGRYLRVAEEACVAGGQVPISDDEPFVHTVEAGEVVATIAERYNVPVQAVLDANPGIANSASLQAGSQLRIPGTVTMTTVSDGPLDAWAVFDDDRTAFALREASLYMFDPGELVTPGFCGEDEANRTPVCLSGQIVLRDGDSREPIWTGFGPKTAWRTTPAPTEAVTTFEQVEVLSTEGERLSGVVDPLETSVTNGHCILAGATGLGDDPCTRVAGADRTAGVGTDEAGRVWTAGDPDSAADHVHDITAESNDECTRLVVTFGEGANEEEAVADTLPPIMLQQLLGSVSVRPDGWQMESAFDDPMRVDYGGGIGLLAVSFSYEFSIEFMHGNLEPHVRFFENPARVVVDLFPSESQATSSSLPFGERFVLRRPIQADPYGPGIPAGEPIVVTGFGRPFEAAGLYRIWAVPNDVDVNAFLADPGVPQHEDFFPTSGWAEAWGMFEITLPELAPGSYIAVFGELPPTDEIGFYGAGQLFRVTDDPSAPGPFPEAALLPDVQLDPEF